MMTKIHLLLAALLVIFAPTASAQTSDPARIVDEAWRAVDSTYYDTSFHGVDWNAVRETYVGRRYSDSNEAYAAIREMLARLDNPATRFLSPDQAAALMSDFGGGPQNGIGLLELLSFDTNEASGEIVVVTPVPGGPAARAGLRPGDVIAAIDGAQAADLGLARSAERMRGEPGTEVRLDVLRDGAHRKLELQRERVELNPELGFVQEADGRRIGYVGLRQFTSDAGAQVDSLLSSLNADAYVLDLRNNPGGFVPALEQIAGLFLGEVPLARIADRTPEPTVLRSSGAQRVNEPVAVLVNEGSASAAEALASALQYHGRARLFGASTFGKGLLHGFVPLSDGSAVMPTVGRLESLDGRDILTEAVDPDVVIPMEVSPVLDPAIEIASENDPQFTQAVVHLRSRLEE